MKFIDKIIADELKLKKDLLGSANPENKCLKLKELRKRKIITNSQIHSYRIEYPRNGLHFSIPRNRKRKFICEGIKNLRDAYNWGEENYEPEELDDNFIMELGKRIVPELYIGERANYRNTGVTILGATTTPPDPYKVREIEMPRLVRVLKELLGEECFMNKIEAAIYAHLHIARIHPFVDGNGRTARALQDLILGHEDIPLPIIESGERYHYYGLLDKAVYDWKRGRNSGEHIHGATDGEHRFYNFMAGKINASFDKVLTGVR